MSGWKVAQWSRERGEGLVASDHFGTLPFSSEQAAVDDFMDREAVLVTLDLKTDPHRVERVAPVEAHFVPAVRVPREAPLLADEVANRAKDAIRQFAGGTFAAVQHVRVAEVNNWTGAVLERCEVMHLAFEPAPRFRWGRTDARLLLGEPVLVDVPTVFQIKRARLSTATERDWLHAHRFPLTPARCAVTVLYTIETSVVRFGFLVAARVEFELCRPEGSASST
jgi:hypothetical protein